MVTLGIVFAILMLLGASIAVSLGMAGVAGILSEGLRTLTAPQRMFTSLDSFVLLAAPFYIFAGEVMYRGGITERLIRFSQFVVGRVRGGTAYAAIIAAILFSGISGTAVADAAALGQVYIRGMPKEGYRKEFAAALIAAAAMIGPIIPPSVIMVIYAGFAGVSVVKMFLAGIIPGLLMGLSLAIVVCFEAVGAILVIALLVIPASFGKIWGRSFGAIYGWALVHVLLSSGIGTWLAFRFNNNVASAIVLVGAAIFVAALGIRRLGEANR